MPTLLPRADFVGLVVDGDDQPIFLPWDVAVQKGLFTEAVEYRPARHRTAPDIDARLIEALRMQAVQP